MELTTITLQTRSVPSVDEFISFVVPIYNEEVLLHEFHAEFVTFLKASGFRKYEIVYVNDGSNDQSFELLKSLSASDSNVKIVNLARNYGKEIALTAGLDIVQGDATVLLDADFQHPFTFIGDFINYWREGHDMVFAVQEKRQQSWLRKRLSASYHRIIKLLAPDQEIIEGAGDFRLLSKRAVNKLKSMREQHRVMKGLYPTIGLKQKGVSFHADPRRGGETKWKFSRLINLALDGITACSIAPLRLATFMGLASASFSMLLGGITITKTVLWGESVGGYPTLVTVVLFLGSVQLLCLGIIGEYLGRIFDETKNRPLYFVEDLYANGQPMGIEKTPSETFPLRKVG